MQASQVVESDSDIDGDLMGAAPRLAIHGLLASGLSQSQVARKLSVDRRAVHSMKNRLVRDKWLVEVEPRSYPRFYRLGPNAPRSMDSPRHAVAWDTPLPPGCRLRYHNAAFGLAVEPPVPPLPTWRTWTAGKGGKARGAAMTTDTGHTLVLRGGTRQPTLVVHAPEAYAYGAEELVRVAREVPKAARDVAVSAAREFGLTLRPRPMFYVQTPEVALEDPNGYVGSFWTDRSKGFHEWETDALLLGYYAAKRVEEMRLLSKSHPDATPGGYDVSHPGATSVERRHRERDGGSRQGSAEGS